MKQRVCAGQPAHIQFIMFKGEMSMDIFEKLLYINDDITHSFHKQIYEFDMISASLAISERYKLLPKEFIEHLKLLPKQERVVQIGKKQRDDKEFSNAFLSYELKLRKQFLEENGIDVNDVIACHSDSLFFITKKHHSEIKCDIDGVLFSHRNSYDSYIKYGKIEMFYSTDGVLDYKGIPKDMLSAHRFGIHKYLMKVFSMLESYEPTSEVFHYLNHFQQQYLRDKLPEYYYIPFGKSGKYKLENMYLFGHIMKIAMDICK